VLFILVLCSILVFDSQGMMKITDGGIIISIASGRKEEVRHRGINPLDPEPNSNRASEAFEVAFMTSHLTAGPRSPGGGG
jgi:hypothetical protein